MAWPWAERGPLPVILKEGSEIGVEVKFVTGFSGEEVLSLLGSPRFLLTVLLEGVERDLGEVVFSGPSLLELPRFFLTGWLPEGVEKVLGKVAVSGPSGRSCSDGGGIGAVIKLVTGFGRDELLSLLELAHFLLAFLLGEGVERVLGKIAGSRPSRRSFSDGGGI